MYMCFFCCPVMYEDKVSKNCCKDRCLPLLSKPRCNPVRNLVEFFEKQTSTTRFISYFSIPTTYYYYCCGDLRDTGWGCAYRCCQMMISSIKNSNVPSILELQRTLVKLKLFKKCDMYSQKWMGKYYSFIRCVVGCSRRRRLIYNTLIRNHFYTRQIQS